MVLRLSLLGLAAIVWSCQKTNESPEVSPIEWEVLTTPVKSSLRGLSALTDDIAWASGSEGVWLRTLDGGKSWDHGVIAGMDTVDFRDIEAFDANTAVAISSGQPAVIYKTTNGGEDWKKVYQASDSAFFDGMTFVNDRRGYVYGDPEEGKWKLVLTLNGGESWDDISSAPKASPGEAGFAASGTGILAKDHRIWMASGGSQSRIFFSEDGGVDWDSIPVPITQGAPSKGIFSLAFINGKNLIAVGGDYKNPDLDQDNIAMSFDEGKSWVKPKGNGPSGYRSGVAYYAKYHWLIAVGPNGSDYSGNAGHNWTKFSDAAFHVIQKSNNGETIWASGPNGKIAKLLTSSDQSD